MSTTQILVLSFAAIALVAAVAIFTIAFRRGGEARPKLDRAAAKRDKSKVAVPEPEPEPALVGAAGPPPVDPLTTKPEVSEEEFGVTFAGNEFARFTDVGDLKRSLEAKLAG